MEESKLRILLEDIRRKCDLLLDGQDALRKEIQEMRRDLVEQLRLVAFKLDALLLRQSNR